MDKTDDFQLGQMYKMKSPPPYAVHYSYRGGI